MRKRKLNYRFHDPNPAAVTADYILKLCVEANMEKVETAIRQASEKPPGEARQPIHQEKRPA